jgi:hypothetical protein
MPRMVCNLVPAGLINMVDATIGQEGFMLTGPGAPNVPSKPLTLASGLPVFVLLNEPRT